MEEIRAQFFAQTGMTESWRVMEPVPGPSEHIRPTTQVAVLHHEVHQLVQASSNYADTHPAGEDAAAGGVEVVVRGARWGLQPSWMKKETRPLINARAETVTEKPSFRSAAVKRRAVIPATAWYEWRQEATGKQCYRLTSEQGPSVLWFAALLEWKPQDLPGDAPEGAQATWVASTTIITATPPQGIADIHDRAPLILPVEMLPAWLDPELTDKASINALIDAVPRAHYVAEPWTLR